MYDIIGYTWHNRLLLSNIGYGSLSTTRGALAELLTYSTPSLHS